MKRTLFMFFILITCVSVYLATTLADSRSLLVEQPNAVNGVLDLRNWDFERQGVISLTGEWSFYFNQFLTPEDFKNEKRDVKGVALAIPANIESLGKVKPFKEDTFYGTMRLVIKLPNHPKVYGLRSNNMLSAYKLFLNGHYQYEVGRVGNTAQTTHPKYKVVCTYFNTEQNQLELIYQVADFTFGDCAISAPRLGTEAAIINEARLGLGKDLFLFGMLLIMGLYHLGLYLLRRKDAAPLYFAVFCLLFSMRMLMVGERLVLDVWPLDMTLYARLSYLCAYLGVGALFGFIYHALSELFPKNMIRMSSGLSLVAAFLTVFTPFKIYDGFLLIFSALILVLAGYVIAKLLYGVYKNVEFAGLVLFGFICMLLALLNDLIYQYTLINKASMIPVGIFIFTLTQAMTLASKFTKAHAMAEKLTEENEKILLELKNSNLNLEYRVVERTKDLEQAMSKLERMSKTDYLTKLPNRRMIFERIHELEMAKRPFYVALADIDRFKSINDTYGHDCGDKILVAVSDKLVETLGSDGFVGRWGGEEFLIVLLTHEGEVAFEMAERLRAAVEKIDYGHLNDENMTTTLTLGLCAYMRGESIDYCIACADEALYAGKESGRNRAMMWGL